MAGELKLGNKVVMVSGIPLTLPIAASDPGSAVSGDLYYNSSSNTVKIYNGTSWQSIVAGSTPASGVLGSIQFSDGTGGFISDAANIFWNDSLNRLGIGTNTPGFDLSVNPASNGTVAQLGATYISALSGDGFLSAGATLSSGGIWTAVTTSAAISYLSSGGAGDPGSYTVYTDTGLTPSVNFTPTARFEIDNNGFVRVLGGGELRIHSAAAGYTGFKAHASAVSVTYTLPPSDGTPGQVLTTDSFGGLSWATAGSGSGANQSLSNLTNPTAINQNLIFDEGAPATIQTKNESVISSWALTVKTGNASSLNSGDLNLSSGSGVASGNVILATGGSTAGSSGGLNIFTGFGTGGQSGNIGIRSGGANTLQSGDVSIYSGDAGTIDINSGIASIYSGDVTGVGVSGDVLVYSGASVNGNSGNINLTIGTPSGTGIRGKIQFEDGSEGTSGYVWTSIDAIGSGAWMPSVSGATWNKELVTLSGTDISNGYWDLAHVALTNSIDFLVKAGGIQIEGAGEDYTVNYTGGAGGNTRITWVNTLATSLIAGDEIVLKYQY